MDERYKEFAEFYDSLKEYDGNVFTSNEFAKYAESLNVCKIEHFIYTAGVLTKKQISYISSYEPDPEYNEVSRDINGDIKSVVRFFFKKYSPELTPTQQEAFKCFSTSVDLYLAYRYTIEVLYYIRFYEPLSGIPNLNYLIKRLNEITSSEIRDNEYFFSYFNIKQSSRINRFFGGDVAGMLITEFAKKLNELVNPEDGEFAAQIGGDNFAIYMKSERLKDFTDFIAGVKIEIRYNNDNYVHSVSARAGIVYIDNSYVNGHVAMNNASRCLTSARHSNKDYVIWPVLEDVSPVISPEFILNMEKDLLNDMFIVYYQPVIESKDGENKIIAAEALARWVKDGSIIIPSRFIDAAGSDGLITKLDLYILDKTCLFISKQMEEGTPLVPITCNISYASLSDDVVVGKIIDTYNKYNVPAGSFGIEFKIPAAEQEVKILENAAAKLKLAGISLTIDDFDMSYNASGLLGALPIDSVKLHCEKLNFTNSRSRIILENLTDLAAKLGFTVICEKIETPELIEEFKNSGFSRFQTRAFEKALSERFFINRLKNPIY
ncbi:MAG: GGDEF domain-containing protein [Saccharofermentans sp.]|nr:GGDEF domain-containing protein [Saccharofermentans sp.]